jgi:hypothetical protein
MAKTETILYPRPGGEPSSADFTVTINGQPLFIYQARVSAFPFNQMWPGYQRPLDQTEIASFAYWDMAKPVKIEVISKRPVKTVELKPFSLQIKPAVSNNKISFTLAKPGQLTVEVNSYHYALHLFANPLEEKKVDVNGPGVTYFGPGVHRPGKMEMKSGETIYIDGGAVVYGAITAREAQNIRVLGRGVLDSSSFARSDAWGTFSCYHCAGVELDGIILRDPPSWTVIPSASRDVRISNIKLIGLWKYNADGIDIVNCQHVRIDRCFIRAYDDCIVLKGLQGRKENRTDDQNLEDVLVTGCVIWNDWGRALEIGAETCADEMKDITFKDCDIIRPNHVALDIQHGDRAMVKNVRFENIRVEFDVNPLPALIQKGKDDTYPIKDDYGFCPRLMVVEIKKTGWNKDPMRGNVRNVVFKDIYVTTPKYIPASEFSGYDETHTTDGVSIQNLVINGKRVKSLAEGKCAVKPYAFNVRMV